MSKINLEEIFNKAAAISKNVPENLQEIAFNRALDALLKVDSRGTDKKGSKKITKKSAESNSQKTNIDYLLENIDRTKYQMVYDAPDVLTRSLNLLSIVQNEFELDGLGPTDLAKILTEKFRIKSSRQAVTAALDAAGNKVDRVSLSNKNPYYRIMKAGEDFIRNKETKIDNNSTNKTLPPKVKKTKPRKKPIPKTVVDNQNSSKKTIRSGRKGAATLLKELIEEKYFETKKGLNDIVSYCSTKKATTLKPGDFSTKWTRFVRDEKLKREQNSEGQYEYYTE